jgi:hypothetical protein
LGEEMASRDEPALERLQAELNELMAHLGAGATEPGWRG